MIHSDANETVVDSVSPGARVPPRARSAAGGDRLEALGHVAMERAADRRQRQCAMPPLEQRHAERVFQRLDLARQRRLRDEQLLGGERERQSPSRGLETAEEVERRQRAQGFMHSFHACKPFRMNG